MIKNVIFDIGGVLTEFDPNDYLKAFGYDDFKAEKVSKAIFKDVLWKTYMIGDVTPEEFKNSVISNNPDLKDEIAFALAKENAHKMLPPLYEGIKFLRNLKEQGFNVYVLSNIVQDSLDYFKENFKSVTDVIDGAVYSCEAHLRKPDIKIYELIMSKYKLNPEETLFLDDSERNVKAACQLKIIGLTCQPVVKEEEFKKVKNFIEEQNHERYFHEEKIK